MEQITFLFPPLFSFKPAEGEKKEGWAFSLPFFSSSLSSSSSSSSGAVFTQRSSSPPDIVCPGNDDDRVRV